MQIKLCTLSIVKNILKIWKCWSSLEQNLAVYVFGGTEICLSAVQFTGNMRWFGTMSVIGG